ncbi:CU044_2847 family protein [Amycolatopsis albispora]|uniref:Trypsin-co-occurring domain-containing protein n=1 Tax=Amycolatopsis albispora TaxID=1804986 RepID=A0A344L572_9PSEU|nr:CU044_2847 family protein [Amycolatopsis albispora]AXB43196.1 hypothetical protein A4R43_12065 [Amycolatopsis albispora]
MTEFVRFPLDGGGSVLVEVEVPHAVERASRSKNMLREAGVSFERALEEVRGAAAAALEKFRAMGPDEVELKFGVKLDAQAGAVIAKTGLQGQFEVKLKWLRDPAAAVPQEETVEDAPAKSADGQGE